MFTRRRRHRWRSGLAPRLEDFLPAGLSDSERRALLRELVAIDLEYRWRSYPTKGTKHATAKASFRYRGVETSGDLSARNVAPMVSLAMLFEKQSRWNKVDH